MGYYVAYIQGVGFIIAYMKTTKLPPTLLLIGLHFNWMAINRTISYKKHISPIHIWKLISLQLRLPLTLSILLLQRSVDDAFNVWNHLLTLNIEKCINVLSRRREKYYPSLPVFDNWKQIWTLGNKWMLSLYIKTGVQSLVCCQHHSSNPHW